MVEVNEGFSQMEPKSRLRKNEVDLRVLIRKDL